MIQQFYSQSVCLTKKLRFIAKINEKMRIANECTGMTQLTLECECKVYYEQILYLSWKIQQAKVNIIFIST